MTSGAVDEAQLRQLVPAVLAALVHRGADFAAAEDAVQEALIRALDAWPRRRPDDPKAWLITTAWRCFIDHTRSDVARRAREARVFDEPPPGPTESADDTLRLYFLCAHPSLTSASAVALTLRALGGLTTRQIAQAYLVPEATMAQRISRAKRTVGAVQFDRPGDLGTVLKVLYLVFNAGYGGDVDLSAEAIRLARQLSRASDDPEVAGLLALFLLHHARRPARTRADGSLVRLDEQDRGLWRHDLIAEGVDVLQAALARDRLGSIRRRPPSRRCMPMRSRPTRPTGCRSSSGTTNWLHSPTARSCGSIVPSQSARPTARTPGCARSPTSTPVYRGTRPPSPIFGNGQAISPRLPGSTPRPPRRRTTSPSATT